MGHMFSTNEVVKSNQKQNKPSTYVDPFIYFKNSKCEYFLKIKKCKHRNNMITISCLTNAKCSLIEFSNTTNVDEIMKYIRTSEYLQMQLAQHESITVSTNMIPNVNKTFTEKTYR
jgi:hypothetical protein